MPNAIKEDSNEKLLLVSDSSLSSMFVSAIGCVWGRVTKQNRFLVLGRIEVSRLLEVIMSDTL